MAHPVERRPFGLTVAAGDRLSGASSDGSAG